MNDGKSAEIPVHMSMDKSKSPTAKEKLSQKSGNFYNSLISTYLLSDKNEESKQADVDDSVENLPPAARNLYRRGLNALRNGLKQNHALLEIHKEKGNDSLLYSLLESYSHEEIPHNMFGNVILIEPTSGIIIFQAEKGISRYLERTYKFGPSVFYSRITGNKPGFIVIQKTSTPLDKDIDARHETHHLIMDILENSGFVRTPKESSPKLSIAFETFRNELAARLAENTQLPQIGKIAGYIQGVADEEIIERALNAKTFTIACMEIAKSRGVTQSFFILPAWASRNFAELEKNFLNFTPLDKELHDNDIDMVAKIIDLGDWNFSRRQMALSLQRIFREKHMVVPEKISLMLSKEI